jgi:hypothetical protein
MRALDILYPHSHRSQVKPAPRHPSTNGNSCSYQGTFYRFQQRIHFPRHAASASLYDTAMNFCCSFIRELLCLQHGL